MVESKELDTFRRQWKDELQTDTDCEAGKSHTKSDADHGKLDSTSSINSSQRQQSSHKSYFDSASSSSVEKTRHASDNSSSGSKPRDTGNSQQQPPKIINTSVDQSQRQYHGSKSNLPPFVIAEKLLDGCSARDSVQTVCLDEGAREEFIKHRNKRLKLGAEPSTDSKTTQDDSFLDLFLADLEEINEIPFFEASLAREIAIKIFRYLEPLELCRCCQVSKAWKSLAEDELLWSQICQYLGYGESATTIEKSQWKEIVKDHVSRERQLRQNWKMRNGEVSSLDYVRGGILCAANSWQHRLVAGYSNGEVRVWDQDDDYTFCPSSTALTIDEAVESGTVSNMVKHVCVNQHLVAASYSQGNVDVWKVCGENKSQSSTLQMKSVSNLSCSATTNWLAASADTELWVKPPENTDYNKNISKIDLQHHITDICFVPKTSPSRDELLVVCTSNEVKVHRLGDDPDSMVTLHNTIGHRVTCVDCSSNEVAAGVQTEDANYKVKFYDLHRHTEMTTLLGHTWIISAMNLAESPTHSIVTGCNDRKVRVYDTRLSDPVIVLIGHAGVVTQVQMDDWKVASGSNDGMVVVWDQRMTNKLWEQHNRHPVGYLAFEDHQMYTANIPADKYPEHDDFDTIYHRRYRGSLSLFDFSFDLSKHPALPSNVLSTYDEPEGYNYNINLAVPYD